MIISNELDRTDLNTVKDYIMKSYRFCKRIYNAGITTTDQFQSFTQLCQNHLDNCNFWCHKFKPKVELIQRKRTALYKDLHYACKYTVENINDMLKEWQATLDKQLEDNAIAAQIEMRARIEHELAIEYKDAMTEKARSERRPIGFNVEQINNDINDSTIE